MKAPGSVNPMAVTGPQLAVLVLVVSLLGVPASKSVVHWLGLPPGAGPHLSQVITLAIEAAFIVTVPGLRKRALSLLRVRVRREQFGELAAVVAVAMLAQFALFGLYALRAWSRAGDGALAGMALDPTRGADAAFTGIALQHLAITCLLAPLVEETVFRGFLLGAWIGTRSVLMAMLFSSAVFAACHMSFTLPFFMAMLLAAVYLRTGALRASILVHFSANVVLWYPLFGQFLIPVHKESIGGWWFQLACLAVLPPAIMIYALVAARSGTRSPVVETLATTIP